MVVVVYYLQKNVTLDLTINFLLSFYTFSSPRIFHKYYGLISNDSRSSQRR